MASLVVKVVGKHRVLDLAPLLRQFPQAIPIFGTCRFVFDDSSESYDWLVAYDELPGDSIRLSCDQRNTLLVTTEPSSIKIYASDYVNQFAHVLSSQEPWALRHASQIYSQPALRWYIGYPLGPQVGAGCLSYEQLAGSFSHLKDCLISTVCSSKATRRTLHYKRYLFTRILAQLIPELHVFGRGVRDISDKAEALARYKYHVVVENHFSPHHITEKMADAFLAECLPFYFGAPNAVEYFPPDSFIPIDIRDPEGAAAVIRASISSGEYESRISSILEAKRRVLENYNLYSVLSRLIESLDTGVHSNAGGVLYSRHALRRRNPARAVAFAVERFLVKRKVRRFYSEFYS